MEALKKAEMAKRQAAAAPAPDLPTAGGDLALEPITAPADAGQALASAGSPADGLALAPGMRYNRDNPPRLDEMPGFHNISLDEPVSRASAPPRASAVTPQEQPAPPDSVANARRDVANAFHAKHPQDATGNRRQGFLIAVGTTTVLALLAIGGYFWWQLQPRGTLGPVATPVRPVAPPAPPALTTSAPPAGVAPVAAPAIPAVPAEPVPAMSAQVPGMAPPPIAGKAVAQDVADRETVRTAGKQPAPEGDQLLRPTRSPLRVNPLLARAFEAMGQSDFAAAQQAYAQVLAADPQNADALHGLANLALRQGRVSDAEACFQRLLIADPQDATALAGLTHLQARQNAGLAESRLVALASSKPDEAGARIALGNIYAGQSRWAEAQQAYFAAHALQPDNPDVLYNLAVALEHLNQPALALQYYRDALQASKRRPAAFLPDRVEERVRALAP